MPYYTNSLICPIHSLGFHYFYISSMNTILSAFLSYIHLSLVLELCQFQSMVQNRGHLGHYFLKYKSDIYIYIQTIKYNSKPKAAQKYIRKSIHIHNR